MFSLNAMSLRFGAAEFELRKNRFLVAADNPGHPLIKPGDTFASLLHLYPGSYPNDAKPVEHPDRVQLIARNKTVSLPIPDGIMRDFAPVVVDVYEHKAMPPFRAELTAKEEEIAALSDYDDPVSVSFPVKPYPNGKKPNKIGIGLFLQYFKPLSQEAKDFVARMARQLDDNAIAWVNQAADEFHFGPMFADRTDSNDPV